mmetsp:Transcript_120539/g.300700  ORF Transcript_120539/g.300700 Transcript_120539/m.300700 type:complete len:202 (+) Transcript_120539:946-1551(+)
MRHVPVMLQKRRSQLVIATIELHLGVADKLIDFFWFDLEVVAELTNALEVGYASHRVIVLQFLKKVHEVFLARGQLLQNFLTALDQRGWGLLSDKLVLVHSVVDHRSFRQELHLDPRNIHVLVDTALQNLVEDGEDQVPVEEGRHLGSVVVPRQVLRLLKAQLRSLASLSGGGWLRWLLLLLRSRLLSHCDNVAGSRRKEA